MRNPFTRRTTEPGPPPGPVVALSPEHEDELRQVARDLLWPGFVGLDHVVVVLEDHELDGADPRAQEAAAGRVAREEWSRREAELAARPGTGDHGRLAAAFETLETQGVLGRMGFTCCTSCGTAEIDAERTPVQPTEGSAYGFAEWAYTFFHDQDAEGLADPAQPLRLTFSAFRPAAGVDPDDLAASRAGDAEARRRVADQTDRIVGALVRDALVDQGLDVSWDGSAGQRIQVAVPDWRKPLPGG